MSTAELKELVAELARSTKELRDSQTETDRLIKETGLQMKQTDRKISALNDLFTGQWGKLVEALVDSGLPALFQERGIAVRSVSRRHTIHRGKDKIAEIDVLLRDGFEDIGVEVKTTCRIADVNEHIERLKTVRAAVPDYESGRLKLLGAMAALKYESEADVYAQRKGLFVLVSREGLFGIANPIGFQPKAW
jgi:hypothetical protein